MGNLLKETEELMGYKGLKPSDILYIGDRKGDYTCTWGEFQKLADIEYDNGYGSTEIATDLVIIFRNQMMIERYEYDGSEQWVFVSTEVPTGANQKIKRLHTEEFEETLKEMNS